MDVETLAEQREVEQPAQPRVGADDRESAAGVLHPPRRAMEDAEEIGVGIVTPAEIHDEARVAKPECEVHATNDPGGSPGGGAANDDRGAGVARALLADLDHQQEVPTAACVETAPSVVSQRPPSAR
jgi:hypothetical protein